MSEFEPSQVTQYDQPFYLIYSLPTNGCDGKDSVEVIVNEPLRLTAGPDTSFTWVSPTLNLDIWATYTKAGGMTWKPRTGGVVADDRDSLTQFSVGIPKSDTLVIHQIYAETDRVAGNVCPAGRDVMYIFVYPSPCLEFDASIDVSNRKLTLIPESEKLTAYRWEVAGETYADTSPTVHLSGSTDSLVLVKLTAFNDLGDSCTTVETFDMSTGSVGEISKTLLIFPNPVDEGFTIEFDGYIVGDPIQIYSATGVKVVDDLIVSDWIDCKNLAPGVYSLQIQHDRKTYLGRFVKR